MAGIYIHIPFCRTKCRYCDFYSVASPVLKEPILEALHRELALRRGEVREPVRTLYIGGGTPTIYSPGEIQGLIDRVVALYPTELDEITVEANPDDLTDTMLAQLRQTAVNRLSIGIQSFDDAALRLFNRRHTGQQGWEAVRRAQEYGFENLSIDLIYGIPGASDEQWESDLRQALALGVPHLSAYHLTLEPRTTLGRWAAQGKIAPVSEEVSERQYEILERLTGEAGYLHYEISNFARPGYRARHNSSYWDGTPYLGIGPAAHSFDGHVRRWNTADNRDYLNELSSGGYFEKEQLSILDRFNETLMTRLRTAEGLRWEELERAFPAEMIQALRRSAARYLASGLLVDEGGALRIPSAFFLRSDAVIADLFMI
ncbi:MAG: radical SAM family heme chaperone HemW [Rikenellaceae bacterium]|nr:radical SAM family heme chaperone HemW [Rikenellaceae bacterium]